MVPDEQQPVMRDFLGLGNLDTGDGGLRVADRDVPAPMPVPYLDRGINMEVLEAGVKTHVCSRGLPTDQGQGLAYTRQWPFPGALTGLQMKSSLLGEAHAKSSSVTQLTIFYAGNVNVYNNISANTAEAILQMAATDNTGAQQAVNQHLSVGENLFSNAQIGQPHFFVDHGNKNCPHGSKLCECVAPNRPSSASSPQPMVPRALPLARKASLARFLEKRRERMQIIAPYLKQQLAHAKFQCPGETVMAFNHGAAFPQIYNDPSKKPFSAMPLSVAVRGDTPSWGYFVKD